MSPSPAPTCATCAHWEEYIPGLGECMEAVKRRKDAFVRAEDVAAFVRDNPPVCARDTESTDSCQRHERREREEAPA